MKITKIYNFFITFVAGGGIEPPIFWLWAKRVTISPTRKSIVEMGGVEPPSWQHQYKVIHKFS